MNPEQRKAMDSKAGVSLFQALAGLKEMSPEDRVTLAEVKRLHQQPNTDTSSQATANKT